MVDFLKGTLSVADFKWVLRAWFLFIWVCCVPVSFAQSPWQTIAPGVEYIDKQNFLTPWSHLHIFRIQLGVNTLDLISANDKGLKQAFVNELASSSPALITVNGGFFDKDFRPLGLRIQNQQQKQALKPISWWGVFYIKDGKAFIKRASQMQGPLSGIEFAIQSGPRLLVAGKIPSLKPGRDERTALGITAEGAIIMVVTENAPITTTELAEVMKAPPILAKYALNLDGGSSTQVYVNLPGLNLDLHGFAMVADAVIVKPKKN